MNPQSLTQWLSALSLAERARALTLVSYWLTIHARDYGLIARESEGQPSALRKLLGINELHHKLVSQIGHYLDCQERTAYPMDVFSQILSQTADNYGIGPALASAIQHAQGRTTPPAC
jgi:hypothetical protein